MFTAMRNIQKDKGVERTEFGETVAQSLFDLEYTSNDLKSDLKDLYINSAVELEKKFSGKDVMPVTMQSPISPFFSSISTFDRTEPKLQTPKHNPSIPSPSVPRLWRPAAQRNIRTQWQKLFTLKQKWHSESLTGRSHATSLVNSYLSQSYMPSMNLGCLSDMPDIREKACSKLAKQQELHQKRLCASYKDMFGVVSDIVYASSSMRQFIKGPTNSPLVTFSSHRDEDTDNGDGGGIPVFKFLSIPYFENLANELVEMFGLELILKRMLVVELLSLSCEESSQNSTSLCWSDELYPGEFDDLAKCNLYSEENCEPIPPRINGWKSNSLITKRDNTRPDEKALEVYLVIWPQEVNVNPSRVGEIFDIVREEIPMISFI